MKKNSTTLQKLKERKCKNCGDVFSGRSDKKYCTDDCRKDFNNRVDTIMRKESRKYGRIMERNLRILRKYLKDHDNPVVIWKNELKEHRFNFYGPFQVKQFERGTYELILGPYVLIEWHDRYELKRQLVPDASGRYRYSRD